MNSLPPLFENELARREADGVRLRQSPMRVTWELEGLPTSDGHELKVRFACSVTGLNEAVELKLLQEILMAGTDVVTRPRVMSHLMPVVKEAALRVAGAASAQERWRIPDDRR